MVQLWSQLGGHFCFFQLSSRAPSDYNFFLHLILCFNISSWSLPTATHRIGWYLLLGYSQSPNCFHQLLIQKLNRTVTQISLIVVACILMCFSSIFVSWGSLYGIKILYHSYVFIIKVGMFPDSFTAMSSPEFTRIIILHSYFF